MPFPIPAQQDLQQLLVNLNDKYAALEAARQRLDTYLPELQLGIRDGNMRIYTGLCTNLSSLLAQYMRLRRLIILPYLNDLQEKEEDGHNCKNCGGSCSVQHASNIVSMRQAHHEIGEVLEHLQPAAISLFNTHEKYPESYQQLRKEMTEMEEILREILFAEESALIPLMLQLQQNIGAHE